MMFVSILIKYKLNNTVNYFIFIWDSINTLFKYKFFIVAERKKDHPQLPTKADLYIQLGYVRSQPKQETDEDDNVKNPPPSPETDGHDNENSRDSIVINGIPPVLNGSEISVDRKVESYEDDYLDITGGADMDIFWSHISHKSFDLRFM